MQEVADEGITGIDGAIAGLYDIFGGAQRKMITKKHLQEVERLNSLPLCQEALKRLKEAKAEYYPESLYLIQLAEWGLENERELHGVKRPMLESVLLNLREMEPQKAFDYLTLNQEEEEEIQVIWPEDLKGDPKDAALVLIEQIGMNVLSNPKLTIRLKLSEGIFI